MKKDKIRHSLCLGRKLKTKVTSFYKTVKGDGADAAFWGCVTVGGESGTRNMAGNVWSTENKWVYSQTYVNSLKAIIPFRQ